MTTDDQPQLRLNTGETPVVNLSRIQSIDTLEVMDADLENLDQIVAAENRAVGFTTTCGSVSITSALAWIVGPSVGAVGTAAYVTVTTIFGIAFVWFALQWRSEAKRRPNLLDKIRNRTKQTVVIQTAVPVNPPVLPPK